MAFTIRPFRDADAQRLSEIAIQAIRVTGSKAYTPEQVEAWVGRHPGAEVYRQRAGLGHMIFVAVDAEDIPFAYALLEPNGHLDRLYAHPDYAGQGAGFALLEHTEEHARGLGIERVFTEASELARGVFERAGYNVIHRRDFTIEHAGKAVPIHNYAMEKQLS